MAALEEYEVLIGGIPHTVLLDEATAKKRGAKRVAEPKTEAKARSPRDKAARPENK